MYKATIDIYIYLLVTEIEGRTASYGPRFSTSIYGPSAKHEDHEWKWKKQVAVTSTFTIDNTFAPSQ